MKDYREYIESWVHEIKLPITALELMVQKEEPKKKEPSYGRTGAD